MCLKPEKNDEQKESNRQIEAQIKKDIEERKHIVKLLILGTGQSGKSTLLKQMQLIYGTGFSQYDREYYRKVIQTNIYLDLLAMLNAIKTLQIAYDSDEIMDIADFIGGLTEEDYFKKCRGVDQDLIPKIKTLWASKVMSEVFHRANEYQLNESIK